MGMTLKPQSERPATDLSFELQTSFHMRLPPAATDGPISAKSLPLRGRWLVFPAASAVFVLAVYLPDDAHAQVTCSGSAPFTCTGTQTTTFTVTPAQNPITFDSGTNITTSAGSAVDGDNSSAWIVTNAGMLIGSARGINLGAAGSSVTNSGTITGSSAEGVFLGQGGSIDNQVGGTISGSGLSAVFINGAAGTLTNSGTIGAPTGAGEGIQFSNGGSIINEAGGTIIAERGIDGGNNFVPIAVSNFGTITGTTQGIATNGGDIINHASGTITGGTIAVLMINLGGSVNTVTNAGTITGGMFSVIFGGDASVLTLQTGSVLNGTVQGSLAPSATTSLVLQGTGTANNDFVSFTSLDVQAGGVWSLNGSSGIGAATVTSGTLVVGDGTHPGANLTGSVAVNSGAALGGQGTVTGNVTVASGGAIAPGAAAPFSTLNVSGNTSFAAGSLFQVKTNAAGQNDKLTVGGTATLTGGSVQVLAQGSGFAASTPYTILHANGGFGGTTFANVTSNLAFLTPSLAYDTTNKNVVLTLTMNGSGGGGGTGGSGTGGSGGGGSSGGSGSGGGGGGSGSIFVPVAQTPNQRAVAAALSESPQNSTLFTTLLNQSVDGARQAFTALSGDVYATTQNVQADQSQILRNAILRRLEQATYSEGTGNGSGALGFGGPELAYASINSYAADAHAAFPAKAPAVPKGAHVAGPNDLTFWTQGLGGFGHVDGDGNAPGTNGTFAGVLTGVDTAFGNATRAGFAAGYIRSDLRSGASSASVDSAQFAAYAGHDIAGPLHGRGGVSYSVDVINSDRAVAFPGLLDLDRSRFTGTVAQMFGEIGYGLTLGRVALEPVAGIAEVHVHRGSFVESGGAAALHGAAATEDIGYSSLGLRTATSVPLANGTVLTPHASAMWQHAFGNIDPVTALTFQNTGTTFSTASVPIAADAALVQGGITWLFAPLTRVTLDYQGTLSPTAQSHLVKAAFSRSF